jgi:hypothetical protein
MIVWWGSKEVDLNFVKEEKKRLSIDIECGKIEVDIEEEREIDEKE